VMATKGPLMVAGDFAPQGRIAQSAKDFSLILGAAAAAGQQLPGAETYLSLMRDCIAAGEADLDNAAVIRAIARKGPVSPVTGPAPGPAPGSAPGPTYGGAV
jgi:3-hydroxyisobutyrate dehydrogenase-like beta-hydroxyacid dehydrogenase